MDRRPDYEIRGIGLHCDQRDLLCWLWKVAGEPANKRGISMDIVDSTGRHGGETSTKSAGHHTQGPITGRSLNRTAWSATLHCLTGCAIGEVLGMVIGTSLGWGNAETIAIAVVLAFLFGYALTMRPLVRSGLPLGSAARLAFVSDTASIAIMEIVDNAIMLVVPGAMDAPVASLLFWASLTAALALAAGAAFPVNRYLIARGRGHAVVHAFHGQGCH